MRILKIDSYLILKSDKKSRHAQTSQNKKKTSSNYLNKGKYNF